MLSPTQSKYCVAMFGVGLFCGLTVHEGDLFHNILITLVGMTVFYITDIALLKFGRHSPQK